MINRYLLLTFLVCLTVNLTACAKQTADVKTDNPFNIEEVASGLGIPWGMVFISDNQILFTEKSGNVKILNLDTCVISSIAGAPKSIERGQGGLMDVAIAPPHAKESNEPSDKPHRWLYFTYSKKVKDGLATALGRGKLDGGRLIDWSELFVSNTHSSRGIHFGSRMAFDNQGHIFVTHGDRGNRSNAQDLSRHAGKVLRLNLDGSIPEDNPFAKQANAMPEIWSYGHRNPQGITFDTKTGSLWVIEHGPRGGDEINRVLSGKNYGWPVISYGKEYTLPKMVGEGTHKAGMEQPVKVYIPSIAPSSLLVYTGDAFPQWQGDLFAGSLALTHLNHIELNIDLNIELNNADKVAAEHRYLNHMNERIRQVIQSPDGLLYISTDSGKIFRLSPISTQRPAH